MTWTLNDYPPPMKNLDPVVREKAIEIANELLEEGDYEAEEEIIALAIQKAEEWANDASA